MGSAPDSRSPMVLSATPRALVTYVLYNVPLAIVAVWIWRALGLPAGWAWGVFAAYLVFVAGLARLRTRLVVDSDGVTVGRLYKRSRHLSWSEIAVVGPDFLIPAFRSLTGMSYVVAFCRPDKRFSVTVPATARGNIRKGPPAKLSALCRQIAEYGAAKGVTSAPNGWIVDTDWDPVGERRR